MEVRWLEQSLADVTSDDTWLSAAEKLRFETFRVPKRRADWRLGRWTAKRAVAAYLRMSGDSATLARIEIRAAMSGAPEVFIANELPGLSISITHSAGVSACAVAPADMTVGCDLEIVEPRSDAFLADYFTLTEQATVKREAPTRRAFFSTLLWSAKESALKVLKLGLRLDIRSVEVTLGTNIYGLQDCPPTRSVDASASDASLAAGDWQQLTVTQPTGQCLRGWWLCTDGLVRTIVTDPSSTAPRCLSALSRDSR
jgi:4'-phosphopantetheinyl transferase